MHVTPPNLTHTPRVSTSAHTNIERAFSLVMLMVGAAVFALLVGCVQQCLPASLLATLTLIHATLTHPVTARWLH